MKTIHAGQSLKIPTTMLVLRFRSFYVWIVFFIQNLALHGCSFIQVLANLFLDLLDLLEIEGPRGQQVFQVAASENLTVVAKMST